jgi:hypothetical protein
VINLPIHLSKATLAPANCQLFEASDHIMPYKAILVPDPTQPKPEGAIRILCLSDTLS